MITLALKGEPVVIIGSLSRHKYGRGLTVECTACGKTKRGLSGPEVAAFYDLHAGGHAVEELPIVTEGRCGNLMPSQTFAPGDFVRVPHGEYETWPGRIDCVTESRIWVRRFNIRNGRTIGLNKTAEAYRPEDVKRA